MEQDKVIQRVALGAAVIAIVLAVTSGRLPRWLRVVLVIALVSMAGGTGLYAYRQYTQPKVLTVAVGSLDGEAARLMAGIATRMASTNSSVRLKVLDKGSVLHATKAFNAGEVDLAIVRPDLGDLSAARTVATITNGTLLIVVPPGSPIKDMDDLKGKAVGIVGGEVNHRISEIVAKEYDLTRAKTKFVDLQLNEIPHALQSKRVGALLVVTPVTEKYLSMLRDIFPSKAKQQLGLIPIESAGAIAAITRYYESYDLPKGTVRGSPPIPDDDMTTLRVPFYLVADKKLDNDTVGALTKSIMETRRDLLSEYPLLAQISEPDKDKDAYIPIHPGSSAYFEGDQKTIFDKYGDQAFYGSMLLGTLASIFAAVWKFMTKDTKATEERPLIRLYALIDQIGSAKNEAELTEIEQRMDDILKPELERYASGEHASGEAAALELATHRLEHAIARRERALDVGMAKLAHS
jgi:TRAP transporter TAXI family solute receptor